MRVGITCHNYFQGPREIWHCRENSKTKNALAALKIASYILVPIPVIIGCIFAVNRLLAENSIKTEKKIEEKAKEIFKIGKPQSAKLQHVYNKSEVLAQTAEYVTQDSLRINFEGGENFTVTIKNQDIFAEELPDPTTHVVVNAANLGLKGGRGMNGQMLATTGEVYKEVYSHLHTYYSKKEPFENGEAILLTGLEEANQDITDKTRTNEIDNVVIVAAPKLREHEELTQEQKNQLYSCYYNSLDIADKNGKASIAFPSLGTGIFRIPTKEAAKIALQAIKDFIEQHPETTLKTISIHFLPSDHASVGLLKEYQQVALGMESEADCAALEARNASQVILQDYEHLDALKNAANEETLIPSVDYHYIYEKKAIQRPILSTVSEPNLLTLPCPKNFTLAIKRQSIFKDLGDEQHVKVNTASRYPATERLGGIILNQTLATLITDFSEENHNPSKAFLIDHLNERNAEFVNAEAGRTPDPTRRADQSGKGIDSVIVVAPPNLRDRADATHTQEDLDALYGCYRNCLALAVENGKTSIAFPPLNADMLNFPEEEAAEVALRAFYDFMQENEEAQLAISVYLPGNSKMECFEHYLTAWDNLQQS